MESIFKVGQKVARRPYQRYDGVAIPAVTNMTVTKIEYRPAHPAGFPDEPVMAPAYYAITAQTATGHKETLMERYFIGQ